MRATLALGVAFLCAFGTAGAASATNLLTNGSFEQPDLAASGINVDFYNNGSTAMAGWTVDALGAQSPNIQLTNNYAFPGLNGTDGIQWLDLTGYIGRGGGVLSDAVATVVGFDYIVSFDVGALFYAVNYGAATVDLVVDGVFAGSYTTQAPNTTGFNWQNYSYRFAGTGTAVRIGLYSSLSPSSSDLGVGLDNVVLDSRPAAPGVPEPASWALVIAGFGLTGCALRRRRSTAPSH